MNPAYSVIFFTTASGAGYGLIFLLALFGALNGVPIDPWFGAIGLGLGTALVTGGLLSSTIHLGHPERAWRAYSQWKSSWLSREGVLATATYVPLSLTAWGWVVMGAIDGNFAFIAALLALMCVLTVHSTGMIYATLRTISAWHNRLTVPGYLAFALLSGSAWFHALAQIFGYQTPEIALVVIVALFLCFYIKRKYWRSIDMYPGPSTPESATGLHDLGKVLCLFGEPQWAVTGDTFPLGCRFNERIVYHEFFESNPDSGDDRYSTQLGIYEQNCGLRNVHLSWGHDEYIYHVLKDYLPEPALYMMRFHSFYAWHRESEYDWLCDDHDRKMLPWVRKFNPYDLYSKSPSPPNWTELRPYYEGLIAKYLPSELRF